MSLVENLVNQISTQGLGGVTKPQGFDLNDDTFAKLLEKNLNNLTSPDANGNQIAGMGAPTGMFIEPFEGAQPLKSIENTAVKPIEIKDVDLGSNYFSNILKTEPKSHQSLMHLAQKHASTAYQIFGKNLVEDLVDLAGDISGIH